jgi:hypothetical protein
MYDTNKLIESIYLMFGEENRKRIDEYMYDMHNDQSLEKTRLGYIGNPIKYAVDIYSRNMLNEPPHLVLVLKSTDTPVAKIALPPKNEKQVNDLIILWEKTGFTVNSRMKKRIIKWFHKPHESGLGTK